MADYSNLSNAEKWRLINSSLDKVMAECDAFFRYRKDSERRKADRRARKDAERAKKDEDGHHREEPLHFEEAGQRN